MNEERLYQVLLQPHLTEKSSMGSGLLRQYAFKVDKTATKKEIKAAIEKLFQVSVRSIRTCNVKSKVKRFRNYLGKQSGWKKAYVILNEGQEIDIAS